MTGDLSITTLRFVYRTPNAPGWWARKAGNKIEWFKVEVFDDALPGIFYPATESFIGLSEFCKPLMRWAGPRDPSASKTTSERRCTMTDEERMIARLTAERDRYKRIALHNALSDRTEADVLEAMEARMAVCARCGGGGFLWLSMKAGVPVRPMPMEPCECDAGTVYRGALDVAYREGIEAAAERIENHSCVASCCDAQPSAGEAKALADCVRRLQPAVGVPPRCDMS